MITSKKNAISGRVWRPVGDQERFQSKQIGESGALSLGVKKEETEKTTSRDQWCQRLDLLGWKELNY